MKNLIWHRRIYTLLICFLCLLGTVSCFNVRQRVYYAEKSNYIQVKGVVVHIAYNEDATTLYYGFSDMNQQFDDNCFKISGKNLSIAQENGIDQKIKMGDQIEFITAQRYFGDGYIMPIVGISVNGEELLGFDEGYANLLEQL